MDTNLIELARAAKPVDGLYACPEGDCERAFLAHTHLVEHAEAVHTFSDTERLVADVVREKYGRRGEGVSSIWTWISDLSADWVVFTVEGDDMVLYKASYSITDGAVTLGEPVEVRRRTVYEPVNQTQGN